MISDGEADWLGHPFMGKTNWTIWENVVEQSMNGGSNSWENRKSMAHDSHDRTNGRFIVVYSWEIPELNGGYGGL